MVDLRTIVPFDDETVVASVRRTGRCVVIQEAQGFGGVGAEIAARVQERCFHALHAPVLRVSGLDIPYPAPSSSTSTCPASTGSSTPSPGSSGTTRRPRSLGDERATDLQSSCCRTSARA